MSWLLPFATVLLFAAQPVSFSDNGIYPALCERLAKDERLFQNFKRDPLFTLFAENFSKEDGEKQLAAIRLESPELLSLLTKAKCNDKLGNPRTFAYKKIGRFSPTTLHYLKIAAELKHHFGPLEGLGIVEIGGGYGGLCTVLSSLFSLKSYTLIDLPGALNLPERYLAAQKIEKVSFFSPHDLPELECDLLISYLAFSETDRAQQKIYLKKLAGAKAGFLICSPAHWKEIPYSQTEHKRVKPLPREEVLAELKALGIEATSFAEEPATGKDHYVIFWKK